MKKLIFSLLIGAIVGWGIGWAATSKSFTLPLYEISFELSIIFTAIALLLVVSTIYYTQKIKRLAATNVDGDEEDAREQLLNKLYSDVTLGTTIAMVLGLVAFSVTVITEQPIPLILAASAVTLLAAIYSLKSPALMKFVQPYRDFPSITDNNYAKKLFAMSDEGERDTMLQGLYAAFTLGNAMLIFAIIACVFYSVLTEESQMFSILVLALIIVVMNTCYMLKVCNR